MCFDYLSIPYIHCVCILTAGWWRIRFLFNLIKMYTVKYGDQAPFFTVTYQAMGQDVLPFLRNYLSFKFSLRSVSSMIFFFIFVNVMISRCLVLLLFWTIHVHRFIICISMHIGISWALQVTINPTSGIPQEHESTPRRLVSVYTRQATHVLLKNGLIESECKLNNVNPHII